MRTLENFRNSSGQGVLLMNLLCGELRVRFLVVEPAHPGSSPNWIRVLAFF